MRVRVVLYSYLREKLPAEAKGRAEIELAEGSTAGDLFRVLNLPNGAAWAVNGTLERDLSKALADGDEVRVFRQGAGG
jgi:molybdopterin converting factor small subunit